MKIVITATLPDEPTEGQIVETKIQLNKYLAEIETISKAKTEETLTTIDMPASNGVRSKCEVIGGEEWVW
jgi:hypothetical protein